MLYNTGISASLYAHFLTIAGEEATVVGTPTIKIYHYDGSAIVTDVNNDNMIQVSGTLYRYDWTYPQLQKRAYVAVYSATYDDGTNATGSEVFRIDDYKPIIMGQSITGVWDQPENDSTYDCSYWIKKENGTKEEIREVLTSANGFKYKPNTEYIIVMKATWKAKLGKRFVDWIPKMTLLKEYSGAVKDITLKQDKWTWWNASWSNRESFIIQNTVKNYTEKSYMMHLSDSNVGPSFNWSNNGKDLRFTDNTNTSIPYYVYPAKWNATGHTADVLVKLGNVTKDVNITIWMYYTNMAATDASDIALASLIGDDFQDNSFNTTKYTSTTKSSTISESFLLFNGTEESSGTNTAPAVTLNAPVDNYNTSDTTPSFIFSFTDLEDTTANCSLYADSVLRGYNATTNNGTATTITASTMLNGTREWYISCNDGTDTGNSTNRTINIQNLIISLNTPTENTLQSSGTMNLTWNGDVDGNITYYGYINSKINFSTTNNYYSQNYGDGCFFWTIMAGNDEGNESVVTGRHFCIDTTNPSFITKTILNTSYDSSNLSTNTVVLIEENNVQNVVISFNGGENQTMTAIWDELSWFMDNNRYFDYEAPLTNRTAWVRNSTGQFDDNTDILLDGEFLWVRSWGLHTYNGDWRDNRTNTTYKLYRQNGTIACTIDNKGFYPMLIHGDYIYVFQF